MLRNPFRSRVVPAIVLTTMSVLAVPGVVAAHVAPVVAHAAKKGKKPLIATINGTFKIRADNPAGFGNDEGPNWQQLTVVIKDLEIPFSPKNLDSASSEESVKFAYEAVAHTDDWSYALGCDQAERKMSGTWTGITRVTVRETHWRETNGKQKKFLGWQVVAAAPKRGIETESTGFHQEWESILMSNCLTIPENEPLGTWSTGFAVPDGLGKLSSDNRSVPLTAINTGFGQTGTAKGSIKFNKQID